MGEERPTVKNAVTVATGADQDGENAGPILDGAEDQQDSDFAGVNIAAIASG